MRSEQTAMGFDDKNDEMQTYALEKQS